MKISNLKIIEIKQWGESSGKRQQNSRRRFAKTKKAGLIKVQEPYRTQNKLETEKRMLWAQSNQNTVYSDQRENVEKCKGRTPNAL